MNAVSSIACIILLWAWAGGSGSSLGPFLNRISPSRASARLAACALIPLYGAQLALVLLDSRLQSASSRYAWMKTLAVPVFDDRVAHHPHVAMLSIALAVFETAAIGTIVLALVHRPEALHKRFSVGVATVLALLSLVAPVMSTTDPYEYAATGLLGLHAYHPDTGVFVGTVYERLQAFVPLKAVIYGPLWVLIDTVQTHLGASVYEKIEAIRATNIVFVALLLALFKRAGAPRSALVGLALNPALWFYSVANPHADIEGLVFLAGAFVSALRGKTIPAVLLLVAAGLIKVPFVIIGGGLLTPLERPSRRWAAWLTAVISVVVLSYLIPGREYMAGLSRFAVHRTTGTSFVGWLAIAVSIAVATIALLTWRRAFFGAAWLFQQMSPLAAPWYFFWGIPYAVATGSLAEYVIALPLGAALLDDAIRQGGAWKSVFAIVIVTLIVDVYVTARRKVRAVARS